MPINRHIFTAKLEGTVAGLLLTTEAMISEKPEEIKEAAGPPHGGGGMPDMGGMGF